jgi:hypothetical protein
MSNEIAKFLNSRRRHKNDVAVARQVRIAKEFGVPVKEPHKFAKHHAMNCGNTNCVMCGNPRKTFKELTQQEKRLFQDVEKTSDKHSNGILPKDTDK